MLATLRRIIQEVNAAGDLRQALDIIVQRVKVAMGTDVCSVYLTEPGSNVNVLMATDGLDVSSVGRVKLGARQGLIGLVSRRAEPVNLEEAPLHQAYHFVPETGEQPFHGFLGVPIIRHRNVLGVLVVQKREPHRFSEDEVSSLVTLAAQLAGAITHAEISGGLAGLVTGPEPVERVLKGQPGAPGVAFGEAVVVYPEADLSAIPDRLAEDPQAEEERFLRAVDQVRADLRRINDNIASVLSAEDRALFDAYMMMLSGDTLVNRTLERIRGGTWGAGALRDTIEEHARVFDAMEDEYLRERGADIRDLGRRILVRMKESGRSAEEYPSRTVLVGEELSALKLAEVPAERLVGVVSTTGSGTSHVAILARAMGLVAIMGVDDLPVSRMDGRDIILDGYRGRVYVSPSKAAQHEYRRLEKEEGELTRGLEDMRDLPSVTRDGKRIELHLNAGLLADFASLTAGADGIGLYRTEFPFMVRDRFPSEQDQYENYRKILETFRGRPVTLRTLDIGGDKALPYFPVEEDNPFLGWRGIRITLDHPDIFLTQLRAMLRASEGLGNLRLLLPMISEMSQLDEVMVLLCQAHGEITEEGCSVALPPVGVMVEVPAAVYQADRLAKRVDFLSIGSNDLTQYLLAVDRNNARVAELYDSVHPAVLLAIRNVVEAGARHNRPVSVCGEMAGDPAAALLLLGMGLENLSMSVASVPRIKWVVRSFTLDEARRVFTEAMTMEDTASIRAIANEALEKKGLGGLLRAGK
ncbi:MAG: phosphoenolpyruvate--protein phosphotransferase [Chromatiales bacterium]|nr:phosphoenolpyruvate--protein phosphotransferase [Chromatiales bacterium]